MGYCAASDAKRARTSGWLPVAGSSRARRLSPVPMLPSDGWPQTSRTPWFGAAALQWPLDDDPFDMQGVTIL